LKYAKAPISGISVLGWTTLPPPASIFFSASSMASTPIVMIYPKKLKIDYSLYYHSSADTPENTTEREPQNMVRAVKVTGGGSTDEVSGSLNRALVHPILGQGPYYDHMWGFLDVWPHNVYLYIANLIGFPGLGFYLMLLFGLGRILKPTVDDLNHDSYADAYLVVARTQLILFIINELKIDFLRNSIYVFQVFLWFGTWTAAYLVSRDHGVRAGKFLATPASDPPPAQSQAA
jgi:hypothetical protein